VNAVMNPSVPSNAALPTYFLYNSVVMIQAVGFCSASVSINQTVRLRFRSNLRDNLRSCQTRYLTKRKYPINNRHLTLDLSSHLLIGIKLKEAPSL
jgi:hypothetical protein